MHATVADLDTAMALRPRIETLTKRAIPQVIERVCDAIDPGQHLRIARLDLDLGRIGAERIEEDVLAALERALTDALGEKLHDARLAPSDAARLLSSPAARMERLEAYLLGGIVPYAPGSEAFEPRAALLAAIADDPDALVTMLKRHGRDQRLLGRLVLQLGGAGLQALIGLLAPADAATIVALVAELVMAHRLDMIEALVPLAEPALERLLWITTLEFLLRDAGSQFNRRRFLDTLLRREAARAGIDHGELLRLLHRGITAAQARSGFRSSLPIVLAALLAEFDLAPEPESDEAPVAADLDTEAVLAAARAGNFVPLEALVRHNAGDRPELEAIVARLDAPLFAGLVHAIEPANADAIVAVIADVTLLNRTEPLMVADGLERMLRWLTLRYLLYDAGSGFNRRRFVAHLLEREAARAGIAYPLLLRLMHEAAERSRARIGFRSSLPATLAELLGESSDAAPKTMAAQSDPEDLALIAARKGDPAALIVLLRKKPRSKSFAALADRLDPALYAAVIAHLKPASAPAIGQELDTFETLHRAVPLAALSGLGFARVLRRVALADLLHDTAARFHRRAWLRRLIGELAREIGVESGALRQSIAQALRRANAPRSMLMRELEHELSDGEPASAGDDAISAIVQDGDPAAAALRLLDLARSSTHLERAAGLLGEGQRRALLNALAPEDAATIAAEMRIFARLHRAEALGSWDASAFDRLLWILAIEHLATRDGARIDRDALIRHLLAGIARHDAETESTVKARVARAVALSGADASDGKRATPPSRDREADVRQAIESFLRTGVSTSGGLALVDAAQLQPAWLAALVRRLARETPAVVPALVGRLLEWLLPEEILGCLLPDGRGRWLGLLHDDAPALRAALETLLKVGALPRGRSRSTMRYDRKAVLAHWLDHNEPPLWAPRIAFASLIEQATLAELTSLMDGHDHALERLRRAFGLLARTQRDVLIARLAPWASGSSGALRALSNASVDDDLMLRAIAATLAGEPFDLDALRSAPALPILPAPAPVSPVAPIDDLARLLAWLDGAPAGTAEDAALARLFVTLADAGNRRLRDHIAALRGDRAARRRWARLLPGEGLARLVDLLAPPGFVPPGTMMLLAAAWRQIAPFGSHRPTDAELWASLLDLAASPTPPPATAVVETLVTALAGDDEAAAGDLRTRALHLARDGGHPAVAAALRRAAIPAAAQSAPEVPKKAKTTPSEPPRPTAEPEEPDHAIYIANAGLALLNPYLPALFERLGVLTADADGKPRIAGIEAMSRAVHLLQYCADTRCDAPEPMLVLNKLLCGLPTGQPVAPAIEPRPEDLEICDGLLDAMIANWPIIGNTSRTGLRETFLQREGRLLHADGKWTLHVQRKGLDILVDQIPWSLSMIYHRWMPEPVHVTW